MTIHSASRTDLCSHCTSVLLRSGRRTRILSARALQHSIRKPSAYRLLIHYLLCRYLRHLRARSRHKSSTSDLQIYPIINTFISFAISKTFTTGANLSITSAKPSCSNRKQQQDIPTQHSLAQTSPYVSQDLTASMPMLPALNAPVTRSGRMTSQIINSMTDPHGLEHIFCLPDGSSIRGKALREFCMLPAPSLLIGKYSVYKGDGLVPIWFSHDSF
jgi:hypothetical protein